MVATCTVATFDPVTDDRRCVVGAVGDRSAGFIALRIRTELFVSISTCATVFRTVVSSWAGIALRIEPLVAAGAVAARLKPYHCGGMPIAVVGAGADSWASIRVVVVPRCALAARRTCVVVLAAADAAAFTAGDVVGVVVAV